MRSKSVSSKSTIRLRSDSGRLTLRRGADTGPRFRPPGRRSPPGRGVANDRLAPVSAATRGRRVRRGRRTRVGPTAASTWAEPRPIPTRRPTRAPSSASRSKAAGSRSCAAIGEQNPRFRHRRLLRGRADICNKMPGETMKRRRFVQAAAGAAAAAVAVPRVAFGAAPLTLKFAHFAAEDHPANVAAKQFAERSRAHQRRDKDHHLPEQPARRSRPAGGADQGRRHRYRAADPRPTRQVPKGLRRRRRAAVPLRQPRRSVQSPRRPRHRWLSPLAEKEGFITLRNWDYGFRNVTNSRHPVNVPDDMKGLKIRTPPGNPDRRGDGSARRHRHPISFAKVYLALSQGVVDGEENP